MLELLHQPVAEGSIAMIEAKICENVLGHRSGYAKGLGFGLKPVSAFKSGQTSS